MKKTIKDFNFYGKKVIIRCDLNVPIENNVILDDTRIKESLISINYLINHKAKVIILSHLGKIKVEEDKESNSLYPVYLRLKELIDSNIYFSEDLMGSNLEEKINNLNDGEVLLLENTRYLDLNGKLESGCDDDLSRYWASLGDIFINDAYGTCHRGHASNVGIAKYLDNGIGFLVEKEINLIDSFMKEESNPFIIIMGGKKISDKTLVIDNLINKCDKILLGGGMCFTFLKASGINIGASIVDDENILYCKEILNKFNSKILLPVDIVTKEGIIKDINNLSDEDIGYDIGPKTIELYKKELTDARRVLINGPMGVFEKKEFQNGTFELYQVLKNNNIKTLVGGGDSASSVNQLGFANEFYHISTGGGATLEYLSGKILPGIDIIKNKEI